MRMYAVIVLVILEMLTASGLVYMYFDAEKNKTDLANVQRESAVHLIDTMNYIVAARESILQNKIDSIDAPKMKEMTRLKKEQKTIHDERVIDGNTSVSMPRF